MPILGPDGYFLKTIKGVVLLSVVGRVGNNAMFPVAYAVVENKNTDLRRWFLDLIKDDIELGNGGRYTIISDQLNVCILTCHFLTFCVV